MNRELKNLRTATAKHFDVGGGRLLAECHIGRLHYRDGALKNGAFHDINTNLEFNASTGVYSVRKASYEAEMTLDGAVTYHNVDHSLQFRLPNPYNVQPVATNDVWGKAGKAGKALIWNNLIQDGGHQIVYARNDSLAKVFHFDKKPLSNQIQFNLLPSANLKFFDGVSEFNISQRARTIVGQQATFYKSGKAFTSWIRRPRAWNHRGESVDVELTFSMVAMQMKCTKTIPQDFIDKTFTEAGGWLETDTTISFYAGSGDGWFGRFVAQESWASIRGGAQTQDGLGASTGYGYDIEVGTSNDLFTVIRRSYFPIDTSSLGMGVGIESAVFSWYIYGYAANWGYFPISLDHCSGAGYAISNYDLVRQAPDIAWATLIAGTGYVGFQLNSTGLENINKIGITQFGTLASADIDNAPPSAPANSYCLPRAYYSEQGGSYTPYLSVVYSPLPLPQSQNPFNKNTLIRM